ncbi:two-component regulator propeller domain-containing protein [Formosa sp. PL04]|uniref:hybrid sensor histidine kinase/response regulator transcription factor n=1 Tax=Formosa sp. PL04 TaxID=3081755 RepID=UPI0029822925|nr:two-component regulator propeller domain-containing protein [Formosa sp. PL04]MDW5290294.1 two-component regulator propeller domain-containing protein [Formosa sp. PL04]
MKKSCLLITIIFFTWFPIRAQNLIVEHLTTKDGLVSNMVHTMLQDSDGFMWFGTEDGLCRYDGYSFLNFLYAPTNPHSLSNNLILALAEDKHKQLWIGTHKGLNKIDLETYKITRFNDVFKDEFGTFTIQFLYVDNNTLWIATDNSGLYTLDINTNKVSNYRHISGDKNTLRSNVINGMLKDPKRGLLVATSKGLDVFDEKTSTFKSLIKDVNVDNLHLQANGDVLVGSFSEANYYLKLKDHFKVEKIKLPFKFSDKLVSPFSDSEGNSWVSVRDYGLIYTSSANNTTHRLLYDKNNPTGINSNTITSFYEDSFGNIWLSSYDAGVDVIVKKRKPFVHVKDNNAPNGLLNNRVRALYQDSEQDIWIGTKANGTLSKFNRDSLSFQHFKPNPQDDLGLSNDYILSITEDKPGFLWVGTLNGLNLFDKATGEFTVFKHKDDDVNSIASNSIYALLKDQDNLYIGNVGEGLDVYNETLNTFTHFRNTGGANQISDNRIKVIYKDKKDDIWIGTVNGLNLFHKNTGTFTHFLHDNLDDKSISENYILSIYEDKKNNFWIGTSTGINLMNTETNTFQVFTTEDGLAGNSVRGILEDDEGNLWLSTNNGLSKFNPETKTFKNYNEYDGLQSNEFSSFVYCKTSDGELLFGGNNGFTIFNPNQIEDNKIIPEIVLTNFKLFNTEVQVNTTHSPLTKHISKTENLVLNHDQSMLSFEFVALNYTTPENNEYAYKMEGFDADWNYIGHKREASYTNLDPGDYVFRVKASNNDGLWNETGTSLKITILPPFWKSWWAYMCYGLILTALVFLARRQVVKRNNAKRAHDIDAMKIKFFANISHEFRTPLTLILSPLDKLLKTNTNPEQEPQLRLMSRHGKRLLNLVNQLLDFQKIDSGELKLKKEAGDIVAFTKELSFLFVSLFNEKHIQFQFKTDIEACETLFDHDKMEKIIFNLLSNAFKFTAENGHVSIKTSKDKNNNFQIEVSDDGIGMPSTELDKIFKRFYQLDNGNSIGGHGSGIGLELVKEYVELHGGKISVQSTMGVGSCFVIQIPLVAIKNEIEKRPVKTHIKDIVIHEETESHQEVKHTNKTPLVLLVEDHTDLRAFLKTSLEVYFKVIEASDGVEGLEQAQSHVPDIIISDVMMPKMDGNEFCLKVKTNQLTSHIPVILLTAQTSEDYKVIGFNNGADQYVTKPFSIDVLKSRIHGLLAQRRALQDVFSKKLDINPSEITVTTIDEQLIKKALEIVEENMSDSNFSVDDLSQALEMSRGHLYRKINSITGNSPSEFIKSMRLKRAVQLLKMNKLTVSEIAYKVGFSNPKYFSKCFKAEFNILPSQFAKTHKNDSGTGV